MQGTKSLITKMTGNQFHIFMSVCTIVRQFSFSLKKKKKKKKGPLAVWLDPFAFTFLEHMPMAGLGSIIHPTHY